MTRPSSPNDVMNATVTKVFDLSLMRDECDTQTPAKKALHRSSSLPTLIEIMTNCITDDESVSSVSTFGSTTSATRRSVFSKYWKKTGQQPSIQRWTTIAPDQLFQVLESAMQVEFSDFEDLPTSAEPTTPQVPCSPARRSFMPKAERSDSVSSLPAYQQNAMPITRRIVSSCELGERKSCLRHSRFSGIQRRPSTSSSVQFNMDAVDVRHFETPVERYAEEGWDRYFAA